MTVMKAIAAALLLAAGVTSVAAAKTAADFPSRPVRLLVPFAAGGPTDVVARILADLLSGRWGGHSVRIHNPPPPRPLAPTPARPQARGGGGATARGPPAGAPRCASPPFLWCTTGQWDKGSRPPGRGFPPRQACPPPSGSGSSQKNRSPPIPFRNWWMLRGRA